jgi:hypothetical protein
MTDTNPIANLPPCGRRWTGENSQGIRIWCRPPVRPKGLSDQEAIRDRAKWFKRREVTCADCLACREQEAVRAVQPGSDTIRNPDTDGYANREKPVEVSGASQPEILSDGTIVYEKTGWEPPTVLPGYKRKSDDLTHRDAWILVRIEPLCKHCTLVQVARTSCNCIRIIPTCTYNGKSKNIQLDECDTCPHKK